MEISFRKGLYFGQTSAVITTIGLIIGLYSSTGSFEAIMSGIIIIAIADALSDSMGMHMSEEAERKSERKIWRTMGATFFSKFVFAMSFIFPFLLLDVSTAILACILWGFFLISVFSFNLGKVQKKSALGIVLEHLLISSLVIVSTYLVGLIVRSLL
jgi:VIT1/CCC1 family predicted Fe2+/Mn2+ transporter